jgi:hypothetical protein
MGSRKRGRGAETNPPMAATSPPPSAAPSLPPPIAYTRASPEPPIAAPPLLSQDPNWRCPSRSVRLLHLQNHLKPCPPQATAAAQHAPSRRRSARSLPPPALRPAAAVVRALLPGAGRAAHGAGQRRRAGAARSRSGEAETRERGDGFPRHPRCRPPPGRALAAPPLTRHLQVAALLLRL